MKTAQGNEGWTSACWFVAALVIAVSGKIVAAGDYEYTIGNVISGYVPDFDQLREPPGGLPEGHSLNCGGDLELIGGWMYCVPTSAINWIAYIDSHGFPGAMDGGPQNWADPDTYDEVTAAIAQMGTWMGTDPDGGTGGAGTRTGLKIWFMSRFLGDQFTVERRAANGYYVPSLTELAYDGNHGGLIMATIGWYELQSHQGMDVWVRQGGHVVSLTGVLCNDQGDFGPGAKLRFRDPASDFNYCGGDYTANSSWQNELHEVEYVDAAWMDSHGNVYDRICARVLDYATNLTDWIPFLDGYTVIWPQSGVVGGPGGFAVLQPDSLVNDFALPPQQPYPSPTGNDVVDIVIAPGQMECYYTTLDDLGNVDPRVWRFNRATQTHELAFEILNPLRLETSRFGHVYVLDGSNIHRMDLSSNPPTAITFPWGLGIDAMVYDDTTDQLYAVSSMEHMVLTLSADLQLIGLNPLPPNFELLGEVYISINPDGGPVGITSQGSATASAFVLDSGGGQAIEVDSITHGLLVGAQGLDISRDDHVFVVNNGEVIEFAKVGGTWVPLTDTPFAGMPAQHVFRLARGRTNQDPGDVDTPNVVPTDFGEAILDCPGDLNGDWVVNAADLALVLGAWGPNPGNLADLNADDAVNAADLALMLGAWGPCE